MFKVGDAVFCKSNFQAPELLLEYPYRVINTRYGIGGISQVKLEGFSKWYIQDRFEKCSKILVGDVVEYIGRDFPELNNKCGVCTHLPTPLVCQVFFEDYGEWHLLKKDLKLRVNNTKNTQDEVKPPEVVAVGEEQVTTEWTDKHYDFSYQLTQQDIENGFVKVDPYFVARIWQLGKKDDSGVLFHNLKNISRYGEKNSKEREIRALYAQIKRLAELEGVEL